MRATTPLSPSAFAGTRLCRGMARLLVALMVFQGAPLRVVSAEPPPASQGRWLDRALEWVGNLVGPGVASADTLHHTYPAGWNQVSVPLSPSDPSAASVFQDVPPPLRLDAYRDGAYVGSDDAGFAEVAPGRGFWLLLEEETEVAVDGDVVDTSSEFRSGLSEGWNAVATPWPVAVEWSDARVSVSDGATTLSLGEAVVQGWIDAGLFRYDPASMSYSEVPANDPAPGKLEPWSGNLVFSSIEGELIFSPPASDGTPPSVGLTAPGEDDRVVWLTDVVGTVSDDDLIQYVLEVAPFGTRDFRTFDTGATSVTGGVLGSFDPTLLLNGLYHLRVSATDLAGNVASTERVVRVDGEAKIGAFTVSFIDLDIPLAGIPILVIRTYDSRLTRRADFGVGWTLDFGFGSYENDPVPGSGWQILPGGNLPCRQVVEVGPHRTVVKLSEEESYVFALDLADLGATLGGCTANAVFRPVEGTFPGATLEVVGDNQVIYANGSDFVTDIDFRRFDPKQVRLTTFDGRVFELNQERGITGMRDRNGNSMTITPTGISHSSGRSVAFVRDGEGRITSVTDPAGKELRYEYDAAGDLVRVTDQEASSTRFAYDSKHLLTEIIDARGVRAARNDYDEEGRLVATTDAKGNRMELDHDLGLRRTVVRDRRGNPTVYGYDEAGNVVSQTDALGHTTTFTYDESGNELTRTDPLGHVTTTTWNGLRRPLSREDPLGHETTWTYNGFGQVLTMTDPEGNTFTNTYDDRGNLLTEEDGEGHVTTHTYDAKGNRLTSMDPEGNTTTRTYDGFGNLTTLSEPGGKVTTFAYDELGNMVRESAPRTTPTGIEDITWILTYDELGRLVGLTDPNGHTASTEYSPNGKVAASIDRNGGLTSFEYDETGNRIRTTHPDNTTETFTYDADHNLTSHTHRDGETTSLVYDELNRLTDIVHPDGTTVSAVYDAAGRVSSTTDENGDPMLYGDDAAGRRTTVTDLLGNVTRMTWDGNGRLVSLTDAEDRSIAYERDGNGRLTKTTFADGSFTTIAYDGAGRKISETDPLGLSTTFERDPAGRVSAVVDPLGHRTTYAYDELGSRVRQTDANGHTTAWEYDGLGRPLKKTLPLGMSQTRTLTPDGRLLTRTDFNGATTLFEYGANGRLSRIAYPDNSEVTFTHDGLGRRKTATDARGVTSYEYDSRGRLTRVDHPDGGFIAYGYDAVGNETSLTVPSGTTRYTWDAVRRLLTTTDPEGRTTTNTRDETGKLTSVTYPNGSVSRYRYDAAGRLAEITSIRSDGSTISSYGYTRDAAGRSTRIEQDTGRVVEYSYDGAGRLTQEKITEPGQSAVAITYAYDAVGNRLSRSVTSGTMPYTYDDNDRLLTRGARVYGYDDNGNLTSETDGGQQTTYGYDFEDRLVSVQRGGDSTLFGYDVDGVRVSSTTNGVVIRYLADSNRSFSQVVEERAGDGSLAVRYVHGAELLSQVRSGEVRHYIYDGNGSTAQLVDSTEATTDSYSFDAFGRELSRTGVTPNAYLFAGEQFDANAEAYYLRARYFSPGTGRFLTRDPLQGFVTDPTTLHRYNYARGDPVNYEDPSGRISAARIGVAIAVAAILATLSTSFWKPLWSFPGRQLRVFSLATKEKKHFALNPEAKKEYEDIRRLFLAWYDELEPRFQCAAKGGALGPGEMACSQQATSLAAYLQLNRGLDDPFDFFEIKAYEEGPAQHVFLVAEWKASDAVTVSINLDSWAHGREAIDLEAVPLRSAVPKQLPSADTTNVLVLEDTIYGPRGRP